MRTTLVFAALVAVIVAGARCKRVNGAYCDDKRPCPSGFACDLTARECHDASGPGADLGGGSIDMTGCNCGLTTPICVAMSCVSCLSTSDPEGACAAVSPTTPHCLTMGGDAGSCVACRDANDCTTAAPFCDATTHMCRGCIADSECPSLVCDLIPGSNTHNTCIPTTMVEYVDANAATNGNGLTPTTPRTGLMDAFNHATGGDNRKYLHLAAGTYGDSLNIGNKTISIVGADGALIKPANMDALGVTAGGSVTVRNVTVTASNGNGGNCQGGTFAAYHAQFVGSKQNGIYASGCALTIDGVWLDANSLSGIYIGSGDFTVINSIITRNSDGGFVQQVAGTAATVFANNTVADNSASGTWAGVSCATTMGINVVNSILYDNKGTAGSVIGESNCAQAFDASDDVSAGPQSTVDLTTKPPGFKGGTPITSTTYHLLSTSPCRHEASPLYAPNHDFDFQPRSSTMPDIGADEAQ